MNSVEAALERIATRRPQLIDLSLDRILRVLARLGDPHKKLPPVFHVAGTNGKGSTVAYLRSILETHGHKIHVYTSPHLVRFNERFIAAGTQVDDARLLDALARCDEAAGEDMLTFFEVTTCAAFLIFSETAADFALIEVGLGGRLDATNVIEKPAAAIVTPVDLDHQQFLGDSVQAIAGEKAGIFRDDAPAVIGRQSAEAMAVLREHAEKSRAQIFGFGSEWNSFEERGRLIYQDENGLADIDPPRMIGAHQFDNASLAIAALSAAGVPLQDQYLSQGVSAAFMPARMQRLTRGPLIDQVRSMGAEASELWLDGGHNPHGAGAAAAVLASLQDRDPKRTVMITGLQENKDAEGYFEPFDGLVAQVFGVQSADRAAASPEAVCEAATAAGLAAEPVGTIEAALEEIATAYKKEPLRLFISGSLYLAGDVLRENA